MALLMGKGDLYPFSDYLKNYTEKSKGAVKPEIFNLISSQPLFLLRTVPGNQEPSPGLHFYYQTINLSVTDFLSAVTFTAAFAEAAYPCSPSVGKIREANVFSPSLMKSSTELASM